MFKPLSIKGSPQRKSVVSLTPKSGLDLRTLPQLLDPTRAIKLRNYIISGDGNLEKRGGISQLFDASSATAITAIEKYTDDIYLFGYASTKVAAYRISTGVVTDIKTDFIQAVSDIERYGDYAFVASPRNKIGRISQTLAYDGQTGNFTAGLLVTGGTSGATAIILTDVDAGATGTLTLGNITGTFQNNEAITDTSTGSATVNGTLAFVYTEITAAPKAKIVTAVNNRLVAGNLLGDEQAVQYSDIDAGTNPPFDNWTTASTDADKGGVVRYKNAGDVNVVTNLGDNIVVGCDNGKYAFVIDTIDSAGTLTKFDRTVAYFQDAGMKASIQTEDGIYYVNKTGVWLLQSIGQSNIKFSDQEANISSAKLGNSYFDDFDFDNADFVQDEKRNLILLTCANDSSQNNFVLTYNTEAKAFGEFDGWAINRFLNDNGTIYGAGSLTSKVWGIFSGNDDDGGDIYYEFEQELSVGQLWTRKSLDGEYIQGKLSPSSTPVLTFNIYDATGAYVGSKLRLQWAYGSSDMTALGYGDSSWGAPFGGDADSAGTVDQFSGFRGKIANFQRIRLNIGGHDKSPHTVNWISLSATEKSEIRRRNLTQI